MTREDAKKLTTCNELPEGATLWDIWTAEDVLAGASGGSTYRSDCKYMWFGLPSKNDKHV